MKNKISADKIVPYIEEKLNVKFENLHQKGLSVIRKQNGNTLTIDATDEATIIATISTSSPDREGDVMVSNGIDYKDFMSNPVVCFAHDYSQTPVAKVTDMQINDHAVIAKIKFGSTERCKEMYSLVKEGILSAFSVGFVALESINKGTKAFTEWLKVNTGFDNAERIITKWTLLEASLVPCPCNPEAVVLMKSLNISEKLAKEFAPEDTPEEVKPEEVKPEEPTDKPTEEKELCKNCEGKECVDKDGAVVCQCACHKEVVKEDDKPTTEEAVEKPMEEVKEESKEVVVNKDIVVEVIPPVVVPVQVERYWKVVAEPVEEQVKQVLAEKKGKLYC